MRILQISAIVLYVVSIFALFLYSFVQVDLGLTLTSHPFWVPYQKAFQEIGYFQRPLSTYLYLSILGGLFISYGLFLYLSVKQVISVKLVTVLSLFTFFILFLSYNAFSYDLFNYIFDARIVTFYEDNPYEKRALDYPADYHLGFMRWIHRTYPYGPIWLGFSIPLSFAGLQSLLLTMILFKTFIGVCYLASIWLIKNISQKVSGKDTVFTMVFFACNPLVIIESLVSSHNDGAMMVFALLSVYLLIQRKAVVSLVSLAVSIGVKFATVFLLPVYVYTIVKKDWMKRFNGVILAMVVCMVLAVLAASYRSQFQPWYLLFILPFASLISKKDYILIPSVVLSFTSLLNYVPYLYFGNWDDPIPNILFTLNIFAVLLSAVLLVSYRIIRRIIFRPHLV